MSTLEECKKEATIITILQSYDDTIEIIKGLVPICSGSNSGNFYIFLFYQTCSQVPCSIINNMSILGSFEETIHKHSPDCMKVWEKRACTNQDMCV